MILHATSNLIPELPKNQSWIFAVNVSILVHVKSMDNSIWMQLMRNPSLVNVIATIPEKLWFDDANVSSSNVSSIPGSLLAEFVNKNGHFREHSSWFIGGVSTSISLGLCCQVAAGWPGNEECPDIGSGSWGLQRCLPIGWPLCLC